MISTGIQQSGKILKQISMDNIDSIIKLARLRGLSNAKILEIVKSYYPDKDLTQYIIPGSN